MRPGTEPSPIHIPVMVPEVLSYLNVRPDGVYLDGTVGLGGHAKHILSHLNSDGRFVGVDRDARALDICKETIHAFTTPISLHNRSYDTIPNLLRSGEIPPVNGILLDLGLSSLQLSSAERGFAYSTDGPLDMRFDPESGVTAESIIQNSTENELADILYQYGEERHSRRIARYIKKAASMTTISDLLESIRRCTAPAHRQRTLARVFQALRIAVNNELDYLHHFLDTFIDSLAIGGRIVIISYHSLEDRPVKHSFKQLNRDGRLRILTKKPITPSIDEVATNSKARSAKLRAAERII